MGTRLRLKKILVLALLACALAGLWWRYAFPVGQAYYLAGNDFLTDYCAGKLVFTGDLYNPERMLATQQAAAGMSSTTLRYIRLPFRALFYWPLAQLPFRQACAVWQLLSIGALIGFLALWRPPAPKNSILAAAAFLPPLIVVFNGQDLNFVLLWIALAAFDLRHDRPVRAGLWFSLCSVKFHLFLLLPVLILGRRMWRFGSGLGIGGTVLLAISLLMEGPAWLLRYPSIITDSRVNPAADRMPTLHAFLTYFHAPLWVEILGVALIALCALVIIRSVELPYALGVVLAAGPLLAVHAYLSDCSLLLPAGLALFTQTRFLLVRVLVVAVMCPPVLDPMKDGYPGSLLVPGLLLALFAAMTYEAMVLRRAPAVQPADALAAG